MKEQRVRSPGWRGTVLVLVGVLLGAMIIDPAVAHVTRKLKHLVKHLNPVYINAGEAAGGSLNGTYPNPGIAPGAIGSAQIADNSVTSAKIADNAVGSSEIADGAVGSSEVANDSLTGSDINESTLGEVPQAQNADDLGGIPASSYQLECTDGAVSGYVLVDGDDPTFPSTFTTAAQYVPEGFNCAGARPLARRVSAGVFNVCFPGSAARLAVVSPVNSGMGGANNFVSWGRAADAGCASPGNSVNQVQVVNDGGVFEDNRFTMWFQR